MSKWLRDDLGQGLVEYALIIAVIAIAVLGAMVFLQSQIQTIFSNIANNLPGGLYINPWTGYINGTVASAAVSGTPYSVTITASDGTNTATTIFAWTISAAASRG